MTYFPTMGSIDPGLFNATKFPGVAYAINPTTHALFMDMQKQLNRMSYGRKMPTRIAVDGKIGEGTRALAKALGFGGTDTNSSMALNADSITAGAKAWADSVGVGEDVPAPKPKTPPMFYDAKIDKLTPGAGASILDSFKDMFKDMSMTTKIALAAAAVGIGYYITKKPKSNPAKRRRSGAQTVRGKRSAKMKYRSRMETLPATAGRPAKRKRVRYLKGPVPLHNPRRRGGPSNAEMAQLYRESRPKWIVRRGNKYSVIPTSRRSK
jgi:hypothetical protein